MGARLSFLWLIIDGFLIPAWVAGLLILHIVVTDGKVAVSCILKLRIGNGTALIYEECVSVCTRGNKAVGLEVEVVVECRLSGILLVREVTSGACNDVVGEVNAVALEANIEYALAGIVTCTNDGVVIECDDWSYTSKVA